MLTRLRVSGFKNLVDVDVRFGPFTCIAGANGTGKSNLFDAIRFLSATADRTLVQAAFSVRDETGKSGDVRRLFHRAGHEYDDVMSFEAEMLVPSEGEDDLGQAASATSTFLRYSLELVYRDQPNHGGPGALEIRKEALDYIALGDAGRHLQFPHDRKAFRSSVLRGKRRAPFISTTSERGQVVVSQHQDGGSRGKPIKYSASSLPRTVLSWANAAEAPTAILARRELQSWRLLQLEPSALRKPDRFVDPASLGTDGSHLAAVLYRLADWPQEAPEGSRAGQLRPRVYSQLANTLAELIDDVQDVFIDRDDRRELYTLFVTDRDGTPHPATSLSDGTLRFLALAVTELDPEALGVICLEEPENGIHPERIEAILRLLQDIAVDAGEPVGPDNPLRQVIVNTHSPAVVGQVPDNSLLVAELREMVREGQRFRRACFRPLPDTWRAGGLGENETVPKGKLLSYLNPILPAERVEEAAPGTGHHGGKRRNRRVADREDLYPFLPFPSMAGRE